MTNEPILVENPERFSLFPIHYPDLYKFAKDAQSALWTAEEITLDEDISDWKTKLTDNERYFVGNVLQFFAASDGIVNENLVTNFMNEVQYPEARYFYSVQCYIESVHSESYALMVDTYIENSQQKADAFNAIQTNPAVKRKGEWAIKWIGSDNFIERLVAFAAVEGIFFSGSFCSIYWLKNRGLMRGLCAYNELISRDEAQHCDFATHLYRNHIINKLDESRVKEILLDALEIEKEFITQSLPVSLIGMNDNLMKQYLEYVTDNLLLDFGCSKHFNSENPFPFMVNIAMEAKTNFFERDVTQYQKSIGSSSNGFNEDF